MTAISQSTENAVQPLALRLFSVDEYHRMIQLGILGEDDPVELLEGLIVRKRHAAPAPEIRVLAGPNRPAGPYPPLPIHQFTVDDYHRLIAGGVLREGEPVELLEGWVVVKMTRNPPHDLALSLAEHEIDRRLPSNWFRRVQSAVTTSESEPEPDLAIVRGPRRRYGARHPGPQDLGLVVEVADSSLAEDRSIKASTYARAGIPVYWILNIHDGQLEVYTEPTGPDAAPRYRGRRDYGATETAPLVLDGQVIGQIPVRDLLP